MRTITQAVTVGFVALSIALASGPPASATTTTASSGGTVISADGGPSHSTPLDTPWG